MFCRIESLQEKFKGLYQKDSDLDIIVIITWSYLNCIANNFIKRKKK